MNHSTWAAGAISGVAAVVVALGAVLDAAGDQRSVRASRRATSVQGDEGYASVGRRGMVVAGDEGYAAVGRRGRVVKGEETAVVVGRPLPGRAGVVVAGEEGVVAARAPGAMRPGYVVGARYESYEGWKVAAGVGAAIRIGTMLRRPPTSAVTITAGPSTYYYADNAYYTRVISAGEVVYQVVAPPAGANISTLPASCTSVRVGGPSYSQCGTTYYRRVPTGYQVVILP